MRRMLGKLTPARVTRARLHKKIYMNFADKIGFVYFGYVDQRDEEQKLVRGLTLSPTHHDEHYTIGTFHGYDVTLLERSDTIKHPDTPPMEKQWLIAGIDLHGRRDLPHIFIGLASHSAPFYRHVLTKFSHLQRLYPGSVLPFDPEFIQHFTIYTTPTYNVYVEQLLGGGLQKQLVQHFPQFSFEITESQLYVYSEHKRPTEALLGQIVQCGVWLATELDRRA